MQTAALLLLAFLSEKKLNYALEIYQIIICPGKGNNILPIGLDELSIPSLNPPPA